jgi:hypothetical protein
MNARSPLLQRKGLSLLIKICGQLRAEVKNNPEGGIVINGNQREYFFETAHTITTTIHLLALDRLAIFINKTLQNVQFQGVKVRFHIFGR